MKAEENLGGLLGKSSRLLSNAFDVKLRDLGLTSQQWSLLAELTASNGRNQTELAGALLKNKASVGSLIDYLKKKDCITGSASPTDRREIIIKLTPKGIAVFAKSVPLANEIIAQATRGVELAELRNAQNVLRQIITNLEGNK